MKAIVVNSFGGREVMEFTDVEKPAAGDGRLLVRVEYAGVGPWDSKTREGSFGEKEFPHILGMEGSGVVEEVGEGIAGFSEGDGIVFIGSPGYAEYASVSPDLATRRPEKVSSEDAAAFPIAGITAYEGIFEQLDLREGQTVLIPGAAGGVGGFAVQIAHSVGAKVIATASSRNHDYLESLGADMTIDYGEGDWVEKVREAVPDGVDAVFDCVGGETFHRSFETVRDAGKVSTIVAFGEESEEGARRGIEYGAFSADASGIKLAWLADRIASGELSVEVQQVFPLSEAAEAHRISEEGHVRGKLILSARS